MGHEIKRRRKITWLAVAFFSISLLFFFGIQFILKTGIFKIPGVVIYDETLNDEEISFLNSVFTEDVVLDKDVIISATDYLEKNDLSDNEFVSSIRVVVSDFYDSNSNINVDSVDELLKSDYRLIDINSLNNSDKLLSINGHYYLDEFNSGAIFRVIKFESEKFDEEVLPLVLASLNQQYPEKDTVLSFAQTGVTALSRGMFTKLNEVGNATYFAENIGDFLSSFDLTHTSNEASFSDYASSNNICSDPRFIDTLLRIGVDIVELTGNHNLDCGDDAASSTIDTYLENGIQTVGGGKSASLGKIPLEIDQKGNQIVFLAYNQSTGGATEDETPGANQYFEEDAAINIEKAKQDGKFVIVDIQYYECSEYDYSYENTTCDYANSSAGDQIGFFRHLIDLGADLVVGTSAHQPQTFELYNNGVIYYGLGNLFFDQIWWPGTTRSLVLAHYFYKGKLLQTKIIPTVYDQTMQTRLMDGDEASGYIDRLMQARP